MFTPKPGCDCEDCTNANVPRVIESKAGADWLLLCENAAVEILCIPDESVSVNTIAAVIYKHIRNGKEL